MGILCTICGVAFSITRLRRQDEPLEAAWLDYQNPLEPFLAVDGLVAFEDCGADSGCTTYDRDEDDGVYKSPWWSVRQEQRRAGVAGFNNSSGSNATDDARDDDFLSETSEGSNIEHVAGPGCNTPAGYNGWFISVEELQGCSTFQCLVSKQEDWQPAVDDEDFERDADFPRYLSGLRDGMPTRDNAAISSDMMYPRRHDMTTHYPDDVVVDELDGYDYNLHSIPFHPSCLEVYKRASVKITGKLDMLGLIGWHLNGNSKDGFDGLLPATKRADNVAILNPQAWDDVWNEDAEWNHANGTEYVAANPLFVPGLASVIAQSTSRTHDIHSSLGAFNLPANTNLVPSPGDRFASLPVQLLLDILCLLPNEDIGRLRLVSRVFRQIPLSLWQKLLMRDMPWL